MAEDFNAPATKGDIQQLRDEMRNFATKTDLERFATKEDLKSFSTKDDLQDLRDGLIEQMRDIQTELLQAFYGYTTTTDAKLKESAVADMALRERLTAVESRVTEIEKRLNQPPAA